MQPCFALLQLINDVLITIVSMSFEHAAMYMVRVFVNFFI